VSSVDLYPLGKHYTDHLFRKRDLIVIINDIRTVPKLKPRETYLIIKVSIYEVVPKYGYAFNVVTQEVP
jgi:hypothetical protein